MFAANQRADTQQQVSDNALKAETEMRNMQLAVRFVRLAKEPEQVAKGRSQFEAARAAQAQLLDSSIALATQQESISALAKSS